MAASASGACGGVTRRTSRNIFGALPNNTSSGRSTGRVPFLLILEHQYAGAIDFADHRERAALAPCNGGEVVELAGVDDQHVALLRLVAPQLHGRHAGLVVGNRARSMTAPRPGGVRHGFGDRIRQTAGAHVVDQQDRIEIPAKAAAVDDFLGAALDFRIAALHRGEVEIGARSAAAHGRRRAAAQADEHGRARRARRSSRRRESRIFSTCLRRTLPRPPAIMMGLW